MGVRCRRWRIADGRILGTADDDVGMCGSADLREPIFSERQGHDRIRVTTCHQARIPGVSTVCIRLHAWSSSA
jgi:hypothetical protein